MQHDSPLLAEAQRQFLICSACRYCEGYCATFPAIEGRTTYSPADITYIANLCHDCRACAQACMFETPHAFAVDIPKLLSSIRDASYREVTRSAAGRFAYGDVRGTTVAALVTASVLLVAIALTGRWGELGITQIGPGTFYRVVPFTWMLVPALALATWTVLVLTRAGFSLLRAARVPQHKIPRAWLGALWDGLSLVYMQGGGRGCSYPREQDASNLRRALHIMLVIGVTLAFVATLAAAITQDVVHILPPYAIMSVPVLSGTAGGALILVGAGGLLALKADPRARERTTPAIVGLDVAFLGGLLVAAASGLALLALRGTAAMGALLVTHLAAIGALFVTAPYGKLIHVPMRLAALLAFRIEERSVDSGGE